MYKHINSIFKSDRRGFTLVEILVALVLLLIIITATFPLLSLATKVTYENRARMIASQLAKSELERTLALVTATNYVMEDGNPEKAPLKSGVYEYYLNKDGEPTVDEEGEYVNIPDPKSRYAAYQIKRIVQWVDDPDDGLFADGTDMNPFDYKVLTIEVTAPSLFTGKATKQADFKTFLAREGASSAITGVMVKVERGWTDENGDRIPVEGVLVNLEDSGLASPAPYASGVTNFDGMAMIPISFSDDNQVYSYNIELDYPGMIPNPKNKETVEARPYTTVPITLEMDKPATLKVVFAPALSDSTMTLSGISDKIIISKNISKGMTSLTFNDLWPAGDDGTRTCAGGTYNLQSDDMLIYTLELGAENQTINDDSFEFYRLSTEDTKNLWVYHDNLNGKGAHWKAASSNFDLALEPEFFAPGEHRIATIKPDANNNLINLERYRPASKSILTKITGDIFLELSGYSPLPNSLPLVYLGNRTAEIDQAEGWEPFLKINIDKGKKVLQDTNNQIVAIEENNKLIDPSNIQFPNLNAIFNEPFRLRFDSHPARSFTFVWNKLDIYCNYEKTEIDFKESGDFLTLHINAQ